MLAADPNAMILAGGHSLLPALANRGQRSGHLIDIGRIEALRGIALDAAGARIGAGVTLSAVLRSPVAGAFPALAHALGFVGNHVVRNRATVGGCLAWADPRGELLLILIAHEARIVTSRRVLAAASLATGAFDTVLEQGEVILEVHIAPPLPIAFDEVIARNSTGRAILSAACVRQQDGMIRLLLGGLADRAVRSDPLTAPEGEAGFAALTRSFVEGLLDRFPALPDAHSLTYRRSIALPLLRRCWRRLDAA